jgi:ectoine hydroxylase-related dioxygenase (phytanoyl-CoA dioxygenase family)
VTTATVGRTLVPRRLVSEARTALLARIDTPEARTDFHLFRYSGPVLALQRNLPHSWRTGTMADPQILIHRPHTGPDPEITYHLDETPDWADGRRYLRIVAVPLMDWTEQNGTVIVKGCGPVELRAGDAFSMDPTMEHSPGVNRTNEARLGVYFRWLEYGPASPYAPQSSVDQTATINTTSPQMTNTATSRAKVGSTASTTAPIRATRARHAKPIDRMGGS